MHVRDANGQAKFWIEPEITLEKYYGLKEEELSDILGQAPRAARPVC